jgi:hypothetical protein
LFSFSSDTLSSGSDASSFFYLLKQTKEAGATTYFKDIKNGDLLKKKRRI